MLVSCCCTLYCFLSDGRCIATVHDFLKSFLRITNFFLLLLPLPSAKPISSPGCPYQFGFFEEEHGSQCNVFYSECAWGVPSRRQCEPAGLFYDERIKGCNWPDQLGCSSENLLNFKCPDEDKGNKYWPYPRYYYNEASIITCVSGQPRLVHCQAGEELVDPNSLTCQSIHPKESKPEPVVLPRYKNRRF